MNPNFFPGEIKPKKTLSKMKPKSGEICLVCINAGMLSSVFLLVGVGSRCRHKTKNYFGTSEFYLSTLVNNISGLAIVILLVVEVIIWLNILINSEHNQAIFVLEIQDFIVTIGIEISLVAALFSFSWKVKTNNLLTGLLTNAKFFEITIPQKGIREIYVARNFCTYGSFLLLASTLFLQATCTPFQTYLELYSTPVGHTFQYFLVMYANMEITIMNKISESLGLSLSKQLRRRILEQNLFYLGKTRKYPLTLEEKLNRTVHAYMELKKSTDSFSELLNPAGLLLVLGTIFQLISEIYVTITFKLYEFKNDQMLSFTLIVTTLAEFFFLGIFVENIENLTNEVEMLICTLSTTNLTVTMSDMFVFRMGLLSAVSGSIVTYVLVAIQFQLGGHGGQEHGQNGSIILGP